MENHKVCCDWCGEKVLFALARYLSGHGAFYHARCLKERRAYNEKDDKAFRK